MMSLGYPLAYPTDVGWLCLCGWRHGDTPHKRIEPTDPIMKPLKRGTPTSQQVSLSLCLLTDPLKRDLAAAVKFSLPPIHSFLRQFLKDEKPAHTQKPHDGSWAWPSSQREKGCSPGEPIAEPPHLVPQCTASN